MRYTILDAYVDEPACFGVPPFVSPYVRYTFGALVDAGVPAESIIYLTIEQHQKNNLAFHDDPGHVIVIGGAVVPGRYLGHRIGTKKDVDQLFQSNQHLTFSLGGPLAAAFPTSPEHVMVVSKDIEKHAFHHARGEHVDLDRSVDEIARWAVLGAHVVQQHPGYPNLIMEMETYRGCPRKHHCSFCSEGLRGGMEFRQPDHIYNEIHALLDQGISRFRLGRQPDILQYMTPYKTFINGFPEPDTGAVMELFNELGRMRRTGTIRTLNIDNANPGTIAAFPRESRNMIRAIAQAVTPGDTIPLGIESFDAELIRPNNLKVTPDEALQVIQLINEEGGERDQGLPRLLPGINLLHGLRGETDKTFQKNFQELERIRDAGLLLRRINIRQVLPYPGTPLESKKVSISERLRNRFLHYRDMIRDQVDIPMMEKVFPPGLIMEDVLPVVPGKDYSYGRQLSSYAVTLKFPLELQGSTPVQALVVDHRQRSIVALPLPCSINTLPLQALSAVPGIGKKAASDIIIKRPVSGKEKIREELGNVLPDISRHLVDDL